MGRVLLTLNKKVEMTGLFLRLPQEREAWIELRQQWIGFGTLQHERDTEVFLGWVQLTISEPRLGRAVPARKGRWMVAAALAACLLAPSPLIALADAVKAVEVFTD